MFPTSLVSRLIDVSTSNQLRNDLRRHNGLVQEQFSGRTDVKILHEPCADDIEDVALAELLYPKKRSSVHNKLKQSLLLSDFQQRPV